MSRYRRLTCPDTARPGIEVLESRTLYAVISPTSQGDLGPAPDTHVAATVEQSLSSAKPVPGTSPRAPGADRLMEEEGIFY